MRKVWKKSKQLKPKKLKASTLERLVTMRIIMNANPYLFHDEARIHVENEYNRLIKMRANQ